MQIYKEFAEKRRYRHLLCIFMYVCARAQTAPEHR